MNKAINYFLLLFLLLVLNETIILPIHKTPSQSINTHSKLLKTKFSFKAYKNNKYEYAIDYRIHPTTFKGSMMTGIFTKRYGIKIKEDNSCFLDKNLKVQYIFQTSNDHYTNNHYSWEIDNTVIPATSTLVNLSTNDVSTEQFTFPESGYSFQALLFILQNISLNKQTPFFFKLLVPPPITFTTCTAKS